MIPFLRPALALVGLLAASPLALGPVLVSAGDWRVDLAACRGAPPAPQSADAGARSVGPETTFCPGSALVYDQSAPGPARPWRKSDGIQLRRDAEGFYQLSPSGRRIAVKTLPPRRRPPEGRPAEAPVRSAATAPPIAEPDAAPILRPTGPAF